VGCTPPPCLSLEKGEELLRVVGGQLRLKCFGIFRFRRTGPPSDAPPSGLIRGPVGGRLAALVIAEIDPRGEPEGGTVGGIPRADRQHRLAPLRPLSSTET